MTSSHNTVPKNLYFYNPGFQEALSTLNLRLSNHALHSLLCTCAS